MFSFAIWDRVRKTLFCARDRLGIKPFYYFWNGRIFVFASEIKALLEHPEISAHANEASLPEYLASRMMSYKPYDEIGQNEVWQEHEVDGTDRRSKVFRWEFRCRFSQVIGCVIKKLLDDVGLFEAAQLAQLSGRECGQGISPVRMDCNLPHRVPMTEKPCRG